MTEREFFIDNLLIRIYCIIVMIRWTGLAPWEFEFPFSGSPTSTRLVAWRDLCYFKHGRHGCTPTEAASFEECGREAGPLNHHDDNVDSDQ